MAAQPTMIDGVFYPKDKMHAPMAGVMVGIEWNPSLGIGGGPVPPQAPVDPGYSPPWARPPVDPGYSPPWAQVPPGGGAEPPHPAHPIVIPGPIPPDPPIDPIQPPPGMVVKPPPPNGGWAYVAPWGWGYYPGSGGAGPKA